MRRRLETPAPNQALQPTAPLRHGAFSMTQSQTAFLIVDKGLLFIRGLSPGLGKPILLVIGKFR